MSHRSSSARFPDVQASRPRIAPAAMVASMPVSQQAVPISQQARPTRWWAPVLLAVLVLVTGCTPTGASGEAPSGGAAAQPPAPPPRPALPGVAGAAARAAAVTGSRALYRSAGV